MTTDSHKERRVSAADANRAFSRLLRETQAGETFVVTSHGRPVARLTPFTAEAASARPPREALYARLRTQPGREAEPWTRGELYDRGR